MTTPPTDIDTVEVIHPGISPVSRTFACALITLVNDGVDQVAAEKALLLTNSSLEAARQWLEVHKDDEEIGRPLAAHLLPGRMSQPQRMAMRLGGTPLRLDTSMDVEYSDHGFHKPPLPASPDRTGGPAPTFDGRASPVRYASMLAHRLASPRHARPTPFPPQTMLVPPSPQAVFTFPYAPLASPRPPQAQQAQQAPPSPGAFGSPPHSPQASRRRPHLAYPLAVAHAQPVSSAWMSLGASKPPLPMGSPSAASPLAYPALFHQRLLSPRHSALTPHPLAAFPATAPPRPLFAASDDDSSSESDSSI
ncbi:uncharacterized protein AMSG_06965 [Thecamonas trahens ATCC 50062]|uniref:Uncharacterized protein n=1 Tax=Thecamonas trahens ATCC 50062 TaxID=461836 RepID=A0A0L0DF68_THETB|nr:hypothetical protein AMSG_06965 [Thecamonas trahens ATCC 50062]KNC50992.1 hypothetical protein AMSG_06965 [Thecamonas trahens ATCC 50062]|eukprot:XP_013756461.1 hypothetical protein AMSG_06965 [Thecamonas trahens ATCC 50062]